jgi:hypothetical protein
VCFQHSFAHLIYLPVIPEFGQWWSALATGVLVHKLDELSYAFRYPVQNDGVTPNFDNKSYEDKTDVINFKVIKELYDDSIFLISYSTEVVNDIIATNK